MNIFDGGVSLEVIEGGDVRAESFAAHGPDSLRYLWQLLRKKHKGQDFIPLTSILQTIATVHDRPSRFKSVSPSLAADMLSQLCYAVHIHVEASCGEAYWTESTCLTLGPGPAGKRNTPLSEAYKAAVLEAAKTSTDGLHARHLLASQKVLASSPETAPRLGTSDSTSRRLIHDHALRVISAGRDAFRSPRTLHWTHDAVTAGGDHNDIFIAWAPEHDLVGIPPFQVLRKPILSSNLSR